MQKNLDLFLKGWKLDKTDAYHCGWGAAPGYGAMNPAERKEVLECRAGRVRRPAARDRERYWRQRAGEAVRLARHAEARGAAGVMALSLLLPRQGRGVLHAFTGAGREATGLGIHDNNFEVVNIDCPISVLKRLKEFPNVVGMKVHPAFQDDAGGAGEIDKGERGEQPRRVPGAFAFSRAFLGFIST